jgi:hypothetical protein
MVTFAATPSESLGWTLIDWLPLPVLGSQSRAWRSLEPDSCRQSTSLHSELRAIGRNSGGFVSGSTFFQQSSQQSDWGSNYAQLAAIRETYDPACIFSFTTVSVRKDGIWTVPPNFKTRI